jgi:DNA-binding transcriptional LysR family regulator
MLRKIDWESQIGRRLRLRDLHVFFTVVQCGSMAKAAVQLGVSQPAISEVIADLEHSLGVRLLDRSPQGVEPTMYGNALLKRSVAAFDELKQSIRDIGILADPTSGELKIGCSEAIAATVLPRLMQRFLEKYPRVALHVDNVPFPAIKFPGLRERKFDLILARLRIPPPVDHVMDDVNVECLFDDPLVVVAGMHNRWTQRRKTDLAELVNEPWIMQASSTWNYSLLAEAFRIRGLDVPKATVVTHSVHLIAHFLTNGPFITAIPGSWVHLNSLKVLDVGLPARPWPVAIVTLKNRTLSPVVERFIECAREVTKSIAGSAGRHTARRRKPNVS